MVSRGLTETEAVSLLTENDEKPMQIHVWWTWKQRNKAKFEQLFTRIRGKRIDNLLNSVQEAADGNPENNVRKDWRAAQWMLSVASPERFASNKPAEQAPPASPLVVISSEVASSVFAQLLPPKEVKALPPVDMAADTTNISAKAIKPAENQ